MRPELRTEMLRILERASDGKDEKEVVGRKHLTLEAFYLLVEHGALEQRDSGYRITVSGYDYYRELKSPRLYWLSKNWFPVAVLIVTSLVTVVANIVGALLD